MGSDSAKPVSDDTLAISLQQAVDRAHDLILLLDADGRIVYANARAVAVYGHPPETLLQLTIHDLDPDFPASTWAQHWASLARCGTLSVQVRHVAADGRVLPVEVHDTRVELDGEPYSFLVARELDTRTAGDARAQLMKFSVDRIDESVFWIGPDARILYANDAASRNLGYASDELVGMGVHELDPNFPIDIWPLHWEELAQRRRLQFETDHRRSDGSVFPVEVTANYLRIGDDEYNCAFVRDISERRNAEGQLRQMATHDTLTGLPNRTLFRDRLDRALAMAERTDGQLAVLFIDLDRMQQVNVAHGHPAGDRVIATAAQRLGQALRRIDTVARWGTDVFVVLVPELTQPEHAGEIAQKLLDTLRLPVTVENSEVVVTASMGIAVYPLDGLDGETLCKNADIAMFRAKEFGGDTAYFFSADLHPQTATRIQTLLELRRAIAHDRFELHYLPAVALDGGRACAAEALVRWSRDGRELHLPESFLDTAEESGIVLELGAMVLEGACAQLAAWRAAGIAAPAVTVNLSQRQLRDPELPDTVAEALRRHGLAATDLQLDLPPALLGGVTPALEGTLTRLAGLGVTLAIDDVGHAPTDFALLQRLPLGLIKLDVGLVARLADDATLALAEALTTAAHRLGARVLAEGVENEALLARVRELGCDQAQGHAVAAPMPAEACAAWLAART